MDYPIVSTDCVQLIAIIISVMRSTKTKIRSFREFTGTSHFATLTSCYTTHFNRFGINKELFFCTIHLHGNPLAYFFAQVGSLFTTVIELSARDKIGNVILIFLQPIIKQPFFGAG